MMNDFTEKHKHGTGQPSPSKEGAGETTGLITSQVIREKLEGKKGLQTMARK